MLQAEKYLRVIQTAGELCELKGSCTVRAGAVGKVPDILRVSGNSLAAYRSTDGTRFSQVLVDVPQDVGELNSQGQVLQAAEEAVGRPGSDMLTLTPSCIR
jgi:hypothetical protein